MSQTIRKELLVQLQHLRSEAKEISRIYVANLQRDIVELIEFLNNNQDRPTLVEMKEKLDAIHLKPEKGRRKDLRKIEQTVRSMIKIAANHKKSR